jgi:hypothetical protein
MTPEVVEALRALEDESRLQPQEVVASARNPESPLHSFFEWDDTRAAESWRIHQARNLIRSVRLEITIEEQSIKTVRYVEDPTKRHGSTGYIAVEALRAERDRLSAYAVLDMELARIEGCLRRAEELARALGFDDAVRSLMKRTAALRRRVTRESPRDEAGANA